MHINYHLKEFNVLHVFVNESILAIFGILYGMNHSRYLSNVWNIVFCVWKYSNTHKLHISNINYIYNEVVVGYVIRIFNKTSIKYSITLFYISCHVFMLQWKIIVLAIKISPIDVIMWICNVLKYYQCAYRVYRPMNSKTCVTYFVDKFMKILVNHWKYQK